MEQPAAKKAKASKEADGVNPHTGRAFSARYYEILEKRSKLPVTAKKDEILRLIRKNQVLILVGETGSGKTTQIPQMILNSGMMGSKKIACTQPRRVAAISVAQRVADEMDVRLGEEVGYLIRFEDVTGPKTLIKYLTDGMLLREAMRDNLLSEYSVIVLDEAHERTLCTDIMLGLLKDVLSKREDLKVVVMSATLDAEKFQKFFNDAPLMNVQDRLFPVEIVYSERAEKDYVHAAIQTVLRIHQNEAAGDVLVFLTGEEEIEDACLRITQDAKSLQGKCGELVCLPMYSALTTKEQQRVFKPLPQPQNPKAKQSRKVVVATNIAETSITVDGIVFVVDCGFVKQMVYHPRLRLDSLIVSPISKASSNQRSGRAGRTRPGKCYRLYPKQGFDVLLDQTHPEILRANMNSVILLMKKIDPDLNPVQFDFIDCPAPETMMRALEELIYLGAMDQTGKVTALGSQMAEFPLDPMLAKCIVESHKYECSEEILSIVALLSVRNIWVRPFTKKKQADAAKAQFDMDEGDHLTLLNAYHAYLANDNNEWCWTNYLNPRSLQEANRVRRQLLGIVRRLKLPFKSVSTDDTNDLFVRIRKALVEGYFSQIAIQAGRMYVTANEEQPVGLHLSTSVGKFDKPRWILYHECVLTNDVPSLRTVSVVEPQWLLDIAPQYFRLNNQKFLKTKLGEALKQFAVEREQTQEWNRRQSGGSAKKKNKKLLASPE